jgi:hypothetical protein
VIVAVVATLAGGGLRMSQDTAERTIRGGLMSVVVYLQTDPYHVSVSQGVKVTPGMFVPIDAADDPGRQSIDVEDGQGRKVASFLRENVVGYHI